MLSPSQEFQQGSSSVTRPRLFGPRQPFPNHKPAIRLLPQCPAGPSNSFCTLDRSRSANSDKTTSTVSIGASTLSLEAPLERRDSTRSNAGTVLRNVSGKGKAKEDFTDFSRWSTNRRKLVRRSRSYDGGVGAVDFIQRDDIVPLRRQATEATCASGTSSQDSQTSIRIVGRGGQGSRVRQASVSDDQLVQSSPRQVRPNLINQTASDSKEKAFIRVLGRGGHGSKQRAPARSPQPPTAPNIRIDPAPPGSLSEKPQAARFGGRGGGGSPPRVSPADCSIPNMPILGLKFKSKLKALHIDSFTSSPLLKGLLAQPQFLTPPLASLSHHSPSSSSREEEYETYSPPQTSQGRGYGTASKLERTLGLVDSAPDSSRFLKRQQRVSRSLSSLGDILSLADRDSPAHATEDTRGLTLECWVDNRFDSTEDAAESLTPVSPIIFSDAPLPQPQDVRASSAGRGLELVQTGQGLTIVRMPALVSNSVDDEEDCDDDDDDGQTSFGFASPTAIQNTPDTPLPIHSKDSPRPPESPIVFNQRRRSSVFLSTKWPKDDLHLLYVDVGTAPLRNPDRIKPLPPRPATLFETHDTPKSPFFDVVSVDPMCLPPHAGMQEKEERLPTARKERTQGWSGQWNRDDMGEVIQSLRQLK